MRILASIAFLACLSAAGTSFAQEAQPGIARPYLEIVQEADHQEDNAVLSQADPRWAWFRIGSSTVQQQGCLAIVIAMVALDRGLAADPLSMLRSFVMNGLFNRNGLLYTSSIGRVLPGLEVLARSALAPAGIDRVEQELAQGRDVLIKLDRDLRRAGIQQHWVRVVRSVTGDLIVADPNGGRVGSLRELYGTTSVVREMLVLGSH